MRTSQWFLTMMAVVFFLTAAAFYPHLPLQIASHWNAAGDVNGYLSRAWGVFLVPIIFLILAAIFLVIPRIDPKRDNIAKFQKYFNYLIIAISIVFYYIYLLTLIWNTGYQFNLGTAIIPPLAALFYVIGMIMPHTEPNWTIGIRTPWTISSDAVWHKTHRAGGWAFRISAVIGSLGTFLPPQIGFWLLLIPMLVSALGLVVYSYMLYEREKKLDSK